MCLFRVGSQQQDAGMATIIIQRQNDMNIGSVADDLTSGCRQRRIGSRTRIRTWNKGSKDPCDTISPSAIAAESSLRE
jgi:hypothetical protein